MRRHLSDRQFEAWTIDTNESPIVTRFDAVANKHGFNVSLRNWRAFESEHCARAFITEQARRARDNDESTTDRFYIALRGRGIHTIEPDHE